MQSPACVQSVVCGQQLAKVFMGLFCPCAARLPSPCSSADSLLQYVAGGAVYARVVDLPVVRFDVCVQVGAGGRVVQFIYM